MNERNNRPFLQDDKVTAVYVSDNFQSKNMLRRKWQVWMFFETLLSMMIILIQLCSTYSQTDSYHEAGSQRLSIKTHN